HAKVVPQVHNSQRKVFFPFVKPPGLLEALHGLRKFPEPPERLAHQFECQGFAAGVLLVSGQVETLLDEITGGSRTVTHEMHNRQIEQYGEEWESISPRPAQLAGANVDRLRLNRSVTLDHDECRSQNQQKLKFLTANGIAWRQLATEL